MFETLFGAEMPLPLRFFIAFLIVLGLIGVTAWIVRRFGADRLGAATARGRQPRLAVIDAATVDGRRRLILIRRDNVEHLLMIGGPTDVVIEPNIVRAAAAREAAPPARAPAATDTLPRAVPLGDGGVWPLQPEPAPAPRPQRMPASAAEEQWTAEPDLPPQPPPRRQLRPADPLAGLAAELARPSEASRSATPADLGAAGAFAPREPARPPRERDVQFEPEPFRRREPVREREPLRERDDQPEPVRGREPMPERQAAPEREPVQMREPQPPPSFSDPQFNANADQNLADMAQRLEAALRRPAKVNDARPPDPASRAMAAELEAAQRASSPAQPRATAPAAAPDTGQTRGEPKPSKSVYDSLEKEMANLLGRPSGKS